MLQPLLSSPSPSATNERDGTFWEEGTEKGGVGQLRSAEESRNNGETIVVQEGEERREFFLLTRMPPPPPSASSAPFFCAPSGDLFAFDPSFSECSPFGFSSSPLFPSSDLQNSQNRFNFLHQNSPLSTDDATTGGKWTESLDEEGNQCETDSDRNGTVAASEDEQNDHNLEGKFARQSLALSSEGPIQSQQSAERSLSPQPLATPICPFCNRSFPHLKGDIRRHVSQCQRLKKLRETANRIDDSHSVSPNDNKTDHSVTVSDQQQINGTNCPSPASVDPSNPYQCRWCQFVTLYKGNMKRHLVACHQVSVHLLNRIQFDIERLRKLSEQRPNWDELPIRPRRDGRDDGWAKGPKGEGTGEGQ